MNNEKVKSLFYFSYVFLAIGIILFLFGILSISNARYEYDSSILVPDVLFGLSFVLIGCIGVLGFILFRIKGIELK